VFGNTSRARCRIIELPRTRYPPELLEHVPARTLLSNFPDSSERPHSKTGYSIRNPTLLETTLNSARYFTLEKSYPEICEMLDDERFRKRIFQDPASHCTLLASMPEGRPRMT